MIEAAGEEEQLLLLFIHSFTDIHADLQFSLHKLFMLLKNLKKLFLLSHCLYIFIFKW